MRRLGVFAVGIVVGCFDPPGGDVLFSCDPDEAPTCPDGYACEADGCCHKDGSDVEHEHVHVHGRRDRGFWVVFGGLRRLGLRSGRACAN
jgi:hypothetical protein